MIAGVLVLLVCADPEVPKHAPVQSSDAALEQAWKLSAEELELRQKRVSRDYLLPEDYKTRAQRRAEKEE